jgi:uncharacterized membrane protein
MAFEIISFASLLFAGVLAGEEFIIRYGVRDPLGGVEARAQIRLRQALVRNMRVKVPTVFGLAFLSGAAATVGSSGGLVLSLRCAGMLALLTFIFITLTGTVPINKALLAWDADTPPETWSHSVARWERLDTARAWAAISAFTLFSAAAVLR